MRKLAILGLFVVALAACQGALDVTPQEDDERVLHALMADDWASAPAVVTAIQQFEREHPGVRVSTRGVAFGQIEEAVRSDLAGPRLYDLVQWHAFAAGPNGFAQPIDEFFNETYEDGYFLPGAIDDITWAGHIYGVPLDVNAVVMIVNVDALREVGHDVDDLGTWDGVREVAASLQDIGMRFTHVPASSWSTYAWVRANRGEIFTFDEDGDPVFSFDDPATIETFDFLHDLVAAGQAFPPVAQDVAIDGLTLFLDQEAAALTTGSWDVAELTRRPPDFEWEVVSMPVGPSADQAHTVLGGSSLFVSTAADDAELAFELATYLIGEEHSLQYAMDDGRLPPQVSVLADPFFDDPRYRAVVDDLPRADAMRLLAFPTVTRIYTDAISDVLELRRAPDVAMTDVQERAPAAAESDLVQASG